MKKQMTKAEYNQASANLLDRESVNLVSCRMALRGLLDVVASGGSPSVEQIEAAQAACVASEQDSEDAYALAWDVQITDPRKCTIFEGESA